ncbi:hypothetical protein GCM10011504_57350 [Siccirubricoccus deserti]|nr:hypothetical protein GCM10011504_57350 [Siccirubricoccus deserti]
MFLGFKWITFFLFRKVLAAFKKLLNDPVRVPALSIDAAMITNLKQQELEPKLLAVGIA